MRKELGAAVVVIALSGAGVALAGVAVTDKQGFFIDLSVRVSPPVTGTARAPQGIGIAIDSFNGNRINGNLIANDTSVVVRLGHGFRENSQFFPGCTVNPKGLSKCSAPTQIASGTGEASIPGSGGGPPTFITAPVRAYNGKPFRGHPTLILEAFINGKPSVEEDFSVTQHRTGPWGLEFTLILLPSTGPTLATTHFTLTFPDKVRVRKVHGRRTVIHLLEAPTTCNGSWKFEEAARFSNAGPITATDSQPCTRR